MKKVELDYSEKIARDVSDIGHYGKDYEVQFEPSDKFDYLMTLIKQA